jgi:hypothetical protein
MCSCDSLGTPNTCSGCRYGVCPGCTFPNEIDCRRHAPIVSLSHFDFDGSGLLKEDVRTHWPKVHRSYWCGDYEARPAPEEP